MKQYANKDHPLLMVCIEPCFFRNRQWEPGETLIPSKKELAVVKKDAELLEADNKLSKEEKEKKGYVPFRVKSPLKRFKPAKLVKRSFETVEASDEPIALSEIPFKEAEALLKTRQRVKEYEGKAIEDKALGAAGHNEGTIQAAKDAADNEDFLE